MASLKAMERMRPSLGGRDIETESPEVERRQAEWERQIQSLDQKETELHQTQMRLLREQTNTFIRDLNALRQEVETMKSIQDARLVDATSAAEVRHRELKDAVDRDKEERQLAHSALHDKVSGLEAQLPDHREDILRLRAQVQGVEAGFAPQAKDLKAMLDREQEERSVGDEQLERRLRELELALGKNGLLQQEVDKRLGHHKQTMDQEREAAHAKVKDLISQHTEVMSKVQGNLGQMQAQLHTTLGQERSELDLQHNTLKDRVERLEKELQGQVFKRSDKLEAEVRELQQSLGSERRQGEACRQQLADHTSRLEAHRASVQERLDYLERLLGESVLEVVNRSPVSPMSRSAAAMERGVRSPTRSPTQPQQQPSQQPRLATAQHTTSVMDRLQFLESAFGDSAERHEKDALQVKSKMDQLHGKLADHHSQLVHHAGLKDRVDRLEKVVGDFASEQSEGLAVAHARLEQLHGRVAGCEKHGPALGELQKAHSGLAADAAARSAQLAAAAERLAQVEGAVGEAAERHGAELEALKASHERHEAMHVKHSKDVEALKTTNTIHAQLAERLRTTERAIAEHAGRHEDALGQAHTKLEQLHGRLATCEANGTLVAEMKRSLTGLASEKAALHSGHASLRDRVDYLENMLGDSADRHTKALEAAQARLEQMQGRVTACERLGGAVGELQKGHSGLAGQKAVLEAKHATMQERIEFLEHQLGDSADKHTREVEALKIAHSKHVEEVKGVKASHSQHAALNIEERLSYLEKCLGEHGDTHERDLAAAHAKMDQMHTRISTCERNNSAIGDLKRAQSGLASEKTMLESAHSTLKERVDYLENLVGDSSERHRRAIEEAKSKADALHGRLAACEKHGAAVAGLQKEHDDHKGKVETHHATVQERLDHLESLLSDHSERHSKELETLRGANGRLSSEAKSQHSRVTEQLAQEKEARDVHHASVQEKLRFLEDRLTEHADAHERHTKALDVHKAAHAKLASEAKAKDSSHAALLDRIGHGEGLVGEVAEKHAQDLAAVHGKLEELSTRISEDRTHREAHAAALESVKKAHANLQAEKSATDQHHAGVGEKVVQLERTLNEHAERHAREVEALKAAHAKHETDSRMREAQHAAAADRAAQAAREKDHVLAQHTSLRDRVEYLEKKIGDSEEKHARDMEAARAAHSKHAKDLDGLRKAHAQHATVEERLDYIEKMLGDSAEKHAAELAAAHAKVQEVKGKVAEEKAAREKHHAVMGESMKQELKKREEHHASMEERLLYLEGLVGDGADKHAKELETHKTAHAKLVNEVKTRDAHHASLAERIGYLEGVLHESADKHAQELAATTSKVDQLHARLGEERAARDSHLGSVRELLKRDGEARDSHNVDLKSRVEHLESLIGEHTNQQKRELETHKAENSRLSSELKGRDFHHATVAERLDGLEKALSSAVAKQEHQLHLTEGKLEQVVTRLTMCERMGSTVGELQKAHGSLASNKTHLDVSHSSLRERLEYIESVLGDSASAHNQALEALRADHSKLAAETRARSAHHTTVSERLMYIEKLLHEQAEKHSEQVSQAHAKVDGLHSRVVACETHGGMIDNLKKSSSNMVSEKAVQNAHNTTTAEKIDSLERKFNDTASRHAQDIQAAHGKIDQLHSKTAEDRSVRDLHQKAVSDHLGKERELRERHHATLEERLARVEHVLGESVDRHSRDLENTSGSIQYRLNILEQKLKDELDNAREHIHGERQLRAKHHDAIAEHLEAERRARDAHEQSVQQHLATEKKAREAHERLVSDHFNREKGARERHFEHMQEMVGREREAREKHMTAHQEFLQRESGAREATTRDLHDAISKERLAREQHHQTHLDATRDLHETINKEKMAREQHFQAHLEHLNREKMSRQQMEEQLAKDRGERGRNHETIGEQVTSLQRNLAMFEAMLRKDMDERSRENRRLWEAMDSQRQELSSQIHEVEAAAQALANRPATTTLTAPAVAAPPVITARPTGRTISTSQSAACLTSAYSRGSSPQPHAPLSVPVDVTAAAPMAASIPAASAAPQEPVAAPLRPLGTFRPASASTMATAAKVAGANASGPSAATVTPVFVQPPQFPRVASMSGLPTACGHPQGPAGGQVGGSMFDQLDSNHDGVISRAEFNQLLGGGNSRR